MKEIRFSRYVQTSLESILTIKVNDSFLNMHILEFKHQGRSVTASIDDILGVVKYIRTTLQRVLDGMFTKKEISILGGTMTMVTNPSKKDLVDVNISTNENLIWFKLDAPTTSNIINVLNELLEELQ